MLVIVSLFSVCIDAAVIALVIYGLFFYDKSDRQTQLIRENLAEHINPSCDIKRFTSPDDIFEEFELQRAQLKIKKLCRIAVFLIYVSVFLTYMLTIGFFTSPDDYGFLYMPIRAAMIHMSGILIVLSLILVVRGWDKRQTAYSNCRSMKYFTMKIAADIFALVSLLLYNHSLIERVEINTASGLNILFFSGLTFVLILQVLWLRKTNWKLSGIVSATEPYDEKERQYFDFSAVHFLLIAQFFVSVYAKLFA